MNTFIKTLLISLVASALMVACGKKTEEPTEAADSAKAAVESTTDQAAGAVQDATTATTEALEEAKDDAADAVKAAKEAAAAQP